MSDSIKYRLIFSIDTHPLLGFTISAWIATVNNNNNIKTASQKIYLNNYFQFDLDLDAGLKPVFQQLDEISDEHLVNRFGVKVKGGSKLEFLINEEKIKPLIVAYVEKRINQLLSFAAKNEILVCNQLKRDSYIVDHLLERYPCEAIANINLSKTDIGVFYVLQITEGNRQVDLHKEKLTVICNQPAWAILGKRLMFVSGINGNMLKPFVNKREVFVPDNLLLSYFKSFVLRLDSSVEIQANGFEMVEHTIKTKSEIQLIESVFDKKYLVKLVTYYQNQAFDFNQLQTERKKIEFSESGKICIHVFKRNLQEEQSVAENLAKIGLVQSPSKVFHLPVTASGDWISAFEWLRDHLSELQSFGISFGCFKYLEKEVNQSKVKITTTYSDDNDWFDVNVKVEVGTFSFPFKQLVSNLKNDDRIYYLPDGSIFIIPLAWFEKYASLVHLSETNNDGFRLTKAQRAVLDNISDNLPDSKIIAPKLQKFSLPATLNAILRPYQLEGFQWLANLYENKLGACLADDMGLGKTLQSIALLLHIKESKKEVIPTSSTFQLDLFAAPVRPSMRALIVLPASLVFNWVIELKKFAPQLLRYVHVGSERYTSAAMVQSFDVILTTYHILVRDVEIFSRIEFDMVILDESQQIKNKDSKMFESVSRLSSPFRLTLSGTPIENSLSDLWAQMQFINPGILGNSNAFKKAFQTPIEKNQDDQKRDELLKIVKPFILRRTKRGVTPDLPELTEFIHYCEMLPEQAEIYEKEKSAVRNMIISGELSTTGKDKIQILNSLQRLRQLASQPSMLAEFAKVESGKFSEVTYMLQNARKSKEKVLVFSSYVRHLEKYYEWADLQKISYSKLTGEVARAQREQEVFNFQENDIPWFFLSLKAGGSGLNLTAAEYVFIIDPWWNPAAEQQAIARAHRIGQHKNVTAIRFITRNTIEEKILLLQQKKQKLAESIIHEDEYILNLDLSAIEELLL